MVDEDNDGDLDEKEEEEEEEEIPQNLNMAEKFRIVMKQNLIEHSMVKMNTSMLMPPPPEELIRKTAVDDEPVKTGAPIPFM